MTTYANPETEPMTWTVDQPVLVTDTNRRDRQPLDGVVVKIGRKYLTVRYSGNLQDQFDLETGRINDNYGHRRVWTTEGYQAHLHRREVVAALNARGVKFDYGFRFTTAMLEKILAAVTEPDAAEGGDGTDRPQTVDASGTID